MQLNYALLILLGSSSILLSQFEFSLLELRSAKTSGPPLAPQRCVSGVGCLWFPLSTSPDDLEAFACTFFAWQLVCSIPQAKGDAVELSKRLGVQIRRDYNLAPPDSGAPKGDSSIFVCLLVLLCSMSFMAQMGAQILVAPEQ